MGLFSAKKKIFVSSVVYNLAGSEDDRVDFLQSTVASSVILDNKKSLGEDLTRTYLKGPAMDLRAFGRWARTSRYLDLIGQVSGTLQTGNSLNEGELIKYLPKEPGEFVSLQNSEIGIADYTYWTAKYVAEKHPTLIMTDWVSDFNEATNTIRIQFASGAIEDFKPDNYDPANKYLYATYITQKTVAKNPPPTDPKENPNTIVFSNTKVFIYALGSGNVALDRMFDLPTTFGTFFPFIPMRFDNKFLSDTYLPYIYNGSKKALKKATNGKYDDVIANIADNPSLGDIDYAYVVFGVSLNVKENACRRYLYEFFQEAMLGYDMSGANFRQWRTDWRKAEVAFKSWMTWRDNPSAMPEPQRLPYPQPPDYNVRVQSPALHYDMQINWSGMEETVGSGLKKPGAKAGELWFEIVGSDTYDQGVYNESEGIFFNAYQMDHVRLNWQIDDKRWRSIDIYGLSHNNMIYGGKSVTIQAIEALQDNDESGFIIPLHEDIYRKMPLKEATQMSTACAFLVFNCYKVVKQKWYQSGWFKIILIVAVIVITVYTGGFGAESIGLLGTNASVGAALGFAGTAAIVAGVVANAVAAMVLMKIISTASSAIFGDQVGAIVSVVATIVAMQVASSYMSTTPVSANLGNMASAENIMKLSVAAGKGYSEYLTAGTQSIMSQNQALLASINQQAEELNKLTSMNLGSANNLFNPIALTDTGQPVVIETLDSFLTRTTMVGSDVASLSMDMITNFADLTLSTRLNI